MVGIPPTVHPWVHPLYTTVSIIPAVHAVSVSVSDDEALGSSLGLIWENGAKRALPLPKV